MSITRKLDSAIERSREAIETDDEAEMNALLDELDEITDRIEELTDGWEAPPPGLEEMVGQMDRIYMKAADTYLETCDLIEDGIRERATQFLDEAKKKLDKAVSTLKDASELSNARLFDNDKGLSI